MAKAPKTIKTIFSPSLMSLPDQGIQGFHIFGKGCAGDIEVGNGQQQCPQQRHGGNLFRRLPEAKDAHQNHQDGAEGHNKIYKVHGSCLAFFSLF